MLHKNTIFKKLEHNPPRLQTLAFVALSPEDPTTLDQWPHNMLPFFLPEEMQVWVEKRKDKQFTDAEQQILNRFWKEKLELHFPWALSITSEKNNFDYYELFWESYNQINERLKPAHRILISAINEGCTDTVDALLKANPECIKAKNGTDMTPLHNAAAKGHKEIIELLLATESALAKDKNDATPLKSALLHAKDNNGATPLHYVARSGKTEAIKLVLNKGQVTDFNLQDNNGATPLHYAAQLGKIDAMLYFIEEGADINVKDKQDNALIHYAAQSGNVKAIQLARTSATDINLQNQNGKMPLHYAAQSGKVEAIQYLLNKGADINAQNLTKKTPLHYAAAEKHVDAVTFLLKKNADVTILDRNLRVPIDNSDMFWRLLELEPHFSDIGKEKVSNFVCRLHDYIRDAEREITIDGEDMLFSRFFKHNPYVKSDLHLARRLLNQLFKNRGHIAREDLDYIKHTITSQRLEWLCGEAINYGTLRLPPGTEYKLEPSCTIS